MVSALDAFSASSALIALAEAAEAEAETNKAADVPPRPGEPPLMIGGPSDPISCFELPRRIDIALIEIPNTSVE